MKTTKTNKKNIRKAIANSFRAAQTTGIACCCPVKEPPSMLNIPDGPSERTMTYVSDEIEKTLSPYINTDEFVKEHPDIEKVDKPSLLKIAVLDFVAETLEGLIAEDMKATGLAEFLADKKFAKMILQTLSENEGVEFRSWIEYGEYIETLDDLAKKKKREKFRLLAQYPSFVLALEEDVFRDVPEERTPAVDAVIEAAYFTSTEKFVEHLKRIKLVYEKLAGRGQVVFDDVVAGAKCSVCRQIRKWNEIVFIIEALFEGIGCDADGEPKPEVLTKAAAVKAS